ncbi:arginine-hydroxylase NDUFAF5, mitochondrial-like [Zerene cesonia]|uniref:arginine-hydroxylase NDUFAF5, mitochondrial-like n=1 Tax=Zerene cesonia TaxID=33412 RepID=UPI0018E4FAF4|nr:arginine-hydroxylase NDUFAF5, mitochondrial-like [Zerene cesonia]
MTVWYPSAWHVMQDVRALGEGNAALSRAPHLRRDCQFAAAALYDEMYAKEVPDKTSRGVPATFQILNFVGWKPDPTQPQPMERGSGEVSLKDLHKIDEIIKHSDKIELRDEDMK